MRTRLLFVITSAALLSGCAAAAINSGTYAVKATKRGDLRPLADAGDAQAQYELGKSWCCMGPGFDTQTATEWLCRAAMQGHDLALYELGRIYDGEVSRTPAPGQKLLRLATAKRSPAHALAFYELAAQRGNPDAAEKHRALQNHAAERDKTQAAAVAEQFHVSCTYEEVFSIAHMEATQ